MDILLELVRKLALLAIFAGFCELLLPRGSFRSLTRMAVGLLVIAMLLQPVLELKGVSLDIEGLLGLANWTVAQGDLTAGTWQQDKARGLVEQQLAQQIREYLAPEYPEHEVQVDLAVSFDDYGNLADFQGMEVTLRPCGIERVQPVIIGGDPGDKSPGPDKIVNSLASHLGLPAAKITLWLAGGGEADGQ